MDEPTPAPPPLPARTQSPRPCPSHTPLPSHVYFLLREGRGSSVFKHTWPLPQIGHPWASGRRWGQAMTGEADKGRGHVAFVSFSACSTCHRLFLGACPLYLVLSSATVGGWAAPHLPVQPLLGSLATFSNLKRLENPSAPQGKMAWATQISGLVSDLGSSDILG